VGTDELAGVGTADEIAYISTVTVYEAVVLPEVNVAV
jgi:hypothetical protein